MSDPRFDAFVAPATPDVFHSVLSSDDVWRPDPLDVAQVHPEARASFDRMVATFIEKRERGQSLSIENRIMLLSGAAGTGKTHLMRAFRHRLHGSARGFFAYLQMGVHVGDYPRYILHNILESFSRPYNAEASNISSLEHLSRSLIGEARELGIAGDLDGPSDFDPEALAAALTDHYDGFANVEPGVLSALLHLQRGLPSVSKYAIKYLRCEDLTPRQRAILGDLPPMLDPESPMRTIGWLADVIAMTYDRPLVICIDQLDLFYADDPGAGERFRAAVATLEALADNPNVLVVLSVLEEYYARLRQSLIGPQLHRLEGGQRPVSLAPETRVEEIASVFARRLAFLYEFAGTAADPEAPFYPFPPDIAGRLSGPPIRLALQAAHDARERSRATGLPPIIETGAAVNHGPSELDIAIAEFDMAWNDFRFATNVDAPTAPHEIEHLLEAAIRMADRELGTSRSVRCDLLEGDLAITLEVAGAANERVLVALTNARAMFGRLAREVRAAAKRAAAIDATPVFLRTDAFPRSTRTQIGSLLDELRASGARLVAMTDSELRTIASFRAFDLTYGMHAHYDAWLARSKPVTSMPGIIALLRLDGVQIPNDAPTIAHARRVTDAVGASTLAERGASVDVANPASAAPAPSPAPAPSANVTAEPDSAMPGTPLVSRVRVLERPIAKSTFDLGTRHNDDERFTLDATLLREHVAIVGAPGSGKTSLAISLVEAALAAGVPALLIDRTGNLATTVAENARLREGVDVAIYTPGNAFGRDLAMPTLPAGLDRLPRSERNREARTIADALGSLMGYTTAAKRTRLTALGIAIATLAQKRPARPFSLSAVIEFIAERGMDLVEALGTADLRFLDPLIEDLESLRNAHEYVLDADAETFDIERLLGSGRHAKGRTTLSIIDMTFIGNDRAQLYWVARLTAELRRYAATGEAAGLNALVFYDDADAYVPPAAKPVTKAPLQALLGAASAAGIGVILASKAPLDLPLRASNRAATWLVGRTIRPSALQKLIDVFGSRGVAALAKLPQLKAATFFGVREMSVPTAFVADPPVRAPERIDERAVLELARRHIAA
jgi:hypothetical protein